MSGGIVWEGGDWFEDWVMVTAVGWGGGAGVGRGGVQGGSVVLIREGIVWVLCGWIGDGVRQGVGRSGETVGGVAVEGEEFDWFGIVGVWELLGGGVGCGEVKSMGCGALQFVEVLCCLLDTLGVFGGSFGLDPLFFFFVYGDHPNIV